MLSFCLVEPEMGNPRPIDTPPLESPCMLGWTAKDLPTHQFKRPLPLELRTRGRVLVPAIYRISHNDFSQSSSSVSLTLTYQKGYGCASIRLCSFGGKKSLRHHIVERHKFALFKIFKIFVYYKEVDRCCDGISTTLSRCWLLKDCDYLLNVIKYCDLESTTYPVVQSHSQIHV